MRFGKNSVFSKNQNTMISFEQQLQRFCSFVRSATSSFSTFCGTSRNYLRQTSHCNFNNCYWVHLCLKVINNTDVPGISHVAIFTLSFFFNLVSKYYTKPIFFSCSCMPSWIFPLSTQLVLVRTAVSRSHTHVFLCAPQTEVYTNKIWDLTVWARSFSWWHRQMNAWGGNSCTELDLCSDLSSKTLGMCREWNLTQE